MLHRHKLLSVPRRLAKLRSSHIDPCAVRALGPILRPALRAQSSCTCLSAASSVAVSRRWRSTGLPFSDTPSPGSSQAKAPSNNAAAASTSLAAHHGATGSTTPVAEQLKSLSPEDRQRIIAALHAPEKEKSSVMGGSGIGPADGDMVAAFTCSPCDYRMVKRFSKHAYTKGIVIVECPNCRAKHLLADNLGWMEDTAVNIEDILKAKGESFIRIGGTEGDYQVMMDPAEAASPT
ncbi:hypothetical protein LSCM1_05282 [Leishmania martiniquensis]|uniref:DNL-type domain-containing protein n=1 Tax=Leishmania martiniquensis TaxID=1580590 RepID=A0A836GQE0_9TRYP|nr:hypothetical protein LSCM1_05282 [Leishmania martiniquensis]